LHRASVLAAARGWCCCPRPPRDLQVVSKPPPAAVTTLVVMRTTARSAHHAVIVGARCAGAPTAMLLARAGHDVLVVDRATLPSDTVSTHGISRRGGVQRNRSELLDDVIASGAPPIRTVSFDAPGEDHVV